MTMMLMLRREHQQLTDTNNFTRCTRHVASLLFHGKRHKNVKCEL